MKYKYTFLFVIFFGIFLFPKISLAQDDDKPTDDLGFVSDSFQDYFFEALKQKGIENYELALKALKKAERAAKKNPANEAVVFYEMGKNLAKLKRYEEAAVNYKKVLEWDNNRLEVMESLYDLYYEEKNYESAILLVQKLIPFDSDYKEDLANLYSKTKQYIKAIELLDELDELWGESIYRDQLRSRIYRATGNSSNELKTLVNKINSKPKKEKEYLNLIYLYSEQGNPKKAFEIAKELLNKHPNSQLVHLALYKFYLDEDEYQKAFNSMKIVFTSQQINEESKYRVLGDFLIFVNSRPQFESELETIVELFSEENNSKVFEKLGDYYNSKQQKEKALNYYKKGLENNINNFSLLKNILLLQLGFKKYKEASKLSFETIEIFPSQPLLYLVNGIANSKMNNNNKAIKILETGLDYIFDDINMEYDFYEQLYIAYTQKGNTKKASFYSNKASELKAKKSGIKSSN